MVLIQIKNCTCFGELVTSPTKSTLLSFVEILEAHCGTSKANPSRLVSRNKMNNITLMFEEIMLQYIEYSENGFPFVIASVSNVLFSLCEFIYDFGMSS